MKKTNKKAYVFGQKYQNVDFKNTAVFKRYANAPFMMEHEVAHKKVIDHFFPNDPAEIYQNAGGRWMTANNKMNSNDVRAVVADKTWFEQYKRILIAGYVQEIFELGLTQYFDQILEAQMQNVKTTVDFYSAFGSFEDLWHNCYTNDDGKFYYICTLAGMSFKEIVNEWMNAANWCKEFLKTA